MMRMSESFSYSIHVSAAQVLRHCACSRNNCAQIPHFLAILASCYASSAQSMGVCGIGLWTIRQALGSRWLSCALPRRRWRSVGALPVRRACAPLPGGLVGAARGHALVNWGRLMRNRVSPLVPCTEMVPP